MSEVEAAAEVATESIVDLFDSSTEGNEVTEVDTETVDKGSETEAKEETQESDKDTTDKATAASEEDKEAAQWTFHAVKDERGKRQKAEARIIELEATIKGKGEEKAIPDVFEDQEGFVKSLQSQHQEDLARSRIQIFREVQIEAHDDYEEKEAKFIELAKANPILITQMNNKPNPAKFVYEQMLKHEQFEEMQDIDAFRDKIRSEERLKLEEESKESKSEQAEKTENISPSLAKARGTTDKAEKLSGNPEDLFE